MSEKWHLRFLEMAKLVSTWSKDPSGKVGSVIVRPDRTVASVGFNGFPRCMSDCESWYNNREEKLSRVVHAEVNALLHTHNSVEGFSIYVYPFGPCDRCAVQLLQAGIKLFVFPSPTEDVLSRWAAAFEKTKQYITECGVTFIEVPREQL